MPKTVLILKRQKPESLHAPEFRELLRSIVREARAVFADAELLELPARGATREAPASIARSAPGSPFLLLLDQGQCLVRRDSLQEMARRLDDSAAGPLAAAAPIELGTLPEPLHGEVLTAGAFDRLVERLAGTGNWEGGQLSDQVLLLRRAAVPVETLGQWAAGELTLAELAEDSQLEVRPAGLGHTFVDYYGEVRREVFDYLPSDVRTVLEVGCGRGSTGHLLRQERGLHVTGVELNPLVAEQAEEWLDDVLVGDVLEIEPPVRYDAILALELFEHLPDGDAFLQRARDWLEPQGRIVLSVPNVGHWSVVEELIRGRWDYLPMGLLCTTHHRFFTRRTLVDWIEGAGYSRVRIVPQKGELPPRFAGLVEGWHGDAESLATLGFWAIVALD